MDASLLIKDQVLVRARITSQQQYIRRRLQANTSLRSSIYLSRSINCESSLSSKSIERRKGQKSTVIEQYCQNCPSPCMRPYSRFGATYPKTFFLAINGYRQKNNLSGYVALGILNAGLAYINERNWYRNIVPLDVRDCRQILA